MKKFALLVAATLVAFAGCAQNDTGMTETTDDTTGVGTPATGEVGNDIQQNEPRLGSDTNKITAPLGTSPTQPIDSSELQETNLQQTNILISPSKGTQTDIEGSPQRQQPAPVQ